MRKGIVFLTILAFAVLVQLPAPSISAPGAEEGNIDPVHSSVLFRVGYFNASAFWGRFNKSSGTVSLSDDGAGSVSVTIAADSVDTAVAGRDKHLKSPDFFNAKQFPEITFTSNKVSKTGADTYDAAGTFAMHGVSKDMTLTFKRTGRGKGRKGESRTGFESVFTLKRSDFGMNFMQGPLGDEIQVTVSFSVILK